MHDFVFSTPNTMEIRGRAKEVGISDLGLRISDLLKKSGIRREESGGKGIGHRAESREQRAERDYCEFRIANCEFRSQEPEFRSQGEDNFGFGIANLEARSQEPGARIQEKSNRHNR